MKYEASTYILKNAPIGLQFWAHVETESMEPTIPVGSRVRVTVVDARTIRIGDVIMYTNKGYAKPAVHRVVAIRRQGSRRYYSTKGDFATERDPYETGESEIIGIVTIPTNGLILRIKRLFVKFFGP